MERRKFLKFGLWTSAALSAGISGAAGGSIYNLAEDLVFPEQKDISDLLNAFLGSQLPEISVGNYNQVRVAEGKSAKPSHYIQMSASRLVCALSKAHPEVELRTCGDYEAKPYQGLTDVVVLGGPISNPDLAGLLGYERSQEDRLKPGILIPKADPKKFKLRWEMLHGDTTLGEFDGHIKKALRFENFEEVERAQYAIRDLKRGRVLHTSVDPATGLLENEYLQIVQLWHPKGYRQTFIWGLHGHSLLGFVGDEEELRIGLQHLLSLSENMGSYQALVPVELQHLHTPQGNITRGKADWQKLLIEPLEQLLPV